MRSILFLAAIVGILSVTVAERNEKVNQTNAEVTEYIRDKLIQLPLARSSVGHFACYDDMNRKIQNITDEGSKHSEECVLLADKAKASVEDELKASRSILVQSVSGIHNSFFECSRKSIGLQYFECLMSTVDQVSSVMNHIKSMSQLQIDQYASGLKQIAGNEGTCLKKGIDDAKTKIDEGFKGLRICLGQESPDKENEVTDEYETTNDYKYSWYSEY